MISLKCKARYTIFLRNKFKFQQRSVEYIVKITGRKTRMTSEDNKITSTRTYLGDLSLRSTMDGTYYSSRPSLIRNKYKYMIVAFSIRIDNLSIALPFLPPPSLSLQHSKNSKNNNRAHKKASPGSRLCLMALFDQ